MRGLFSRRFVFSFNLMVVTTIEVMIAAHVGTWERSCVCFVDAGLEALGCQNEVYLAVNLPIRGTPGCCPRQLVGVESVAKGESIALFKL